MKTKSNGKNLPTKEKSKEYVLKMLEDELVA